MAYLGTQEVKFNLYVDKSGVRYQLRHRYDCDSCGRPHFLRVRAEEPFYCDCQRLIDINVKPGEQHVCTHGIYDLERGTLESPAVSGAV